MNPYSADDKNIKNIQVCLFRKELKDHGEITPWGTEQPWDFCKNSTRRETQGTLVMQLSGHWEKPMQI